MRSWVPVPGTTTGRLVAAALELFGAHGFTSVAVGTIAEHAGVTTGSLYHHFGSKLGLYEVVRTDVEQRVLDRIEGAASLRTVRTLADLSPVLLVGFDYVVNSGFARLLGEPFPGPLDVDRPSDGIERLIARLLATENVPLEQLVAAAWRVALWHASNGAQSVGAARAALELLLAGD